MPQAARVNARAAHVDKEAAKAQEQEFKRARGAISCAECRRLKLKCDKTIPCSSCKRRGCASICPNGSLATGQGTRFILADTDRLHRKIEEMSDRIRQLEDALAILQSTSSREPHPLLRRDLLEIKSGLQLHSALRTNSSSDVMQTPTELDEESQCIDAFGTLEVRDHGAATFFGRSAGSESILLVEKQSEKPDGTGLSPASAITASPSPSPVAQIAAATFPASHANTDIGHLSAVDKQILLEEQLPSWPRARALCDLYLEQAPWFFGAVARRQLFEEVVPLLYPEASDGNVPTDSPPSHGLSPSPSASSTSSSTLTVATSVTAFNLAPSSSSSSMVGTATPHDLALIFVVFCFGALTDPALPPAPHNTEADRYYELTRAALNLCPVFDKPPSVVTVQTLSLMGIYQGLVADENSIESTWALMGMSCKLAQSIGLHRDGARWKLTPTEVQKRRALFWELFITDCWQGLATGRLPTFALPYIDTELAEDQEQTLADDGTPQASFPAWKAMWGKECVSTLVEVTLQARAPKYSLILELDRKIRDTPLPRYAEGDAPKNASLSETMKHFMPINYRELTLLYVHRCFFAEALADHPSDPMRSQYAPSFMAGYRSACTLISSLRQQFEINQVQIARFWVLWTHAFSSTVMLGSVVTRGGTTKMAHAALGELRLAYDLFERAAKFGGRAVKFLPIVRKLHDKALHSFNQGYQLRKDIFAPRPPQGEELDELSLIGGRTRTVERSPPTQPLPVQGSKQSVPRRRISPGVSSQMHSPGGSAASGSDSARSSQSPRAPGGAELPPPAPADELPSLVSYGRAVHPMLVDGMRTFERSLDVQISKAQEVFYAMDAAPQETHPVVEESEAFQHVQGHGHGPDHEHGYNLQYNAQPAQAQMQVQEYEHAAAAPPTWGYPPQTQEMLQQHPEPVPEPQMHGHRDTAQLYHLQSQQQHQMSHMQPYEQHPQYEQHPHAQYSPPPPPVDAGTGHYVDSVTMYGTVEGHSPPMVQGYSPPTAQENNAQTAQGYNAQMTRGYHYEEIEYPAPGQEHPDVTAGVPVAIQQEYVAMPQHASLNAHEQVHVWHAAPAPPATHVQDTYAMQYHQHQHYPQTPQATEYAQMHMHQQPQQHHHQHHHHYVAPPPPPQQQQQQQPSVMSGYSMTDTWTSFMQQELPIPMNMGGPPGAQRVGVGGARGYQSGMR